MNFDNITLTKGSFFNLDTGEEIGELSFDECECTMSEPTEKLSLGFNGSATFSFDAEVNTSLLKKLTKPLPEAYDIEMQIPVQRRKHKKKRINKKWAKRYGYVMKSIFTKGWKIHTETNGNTEFIKDNISQEEVKEFKKYGK